MLQALEAAATCGVTRLADVTRLDRIGVPVFQAVRPWGRALSVHQGKGLTVEAAKIGALMEAVESDHAETFAGPTVRRPFDDLPLDERAGTMADFAVDRDDPPSAQAPRAWVAARRLADDSRIWVPFEEVSLDFRARGDPRLQRSSNGLGAHWTLARATLKGLLEVVERDAEAKWLTLPAYRRSLDRLDIASIPFAWLKDMRERIAGAGLDLAVYHLPTVIGLPAFAAEIVERKAVAGTPRAVCGASCHPLAEEALLGAMLEAIQSRVTLIAGVRDDIRFNDPAQPAPGFQGFGPPLPPHIAAKPWPAVIEAGSRHGDPTSVDLAGLLASRGYPDAAAVDLSRTEGTAKVVKVFIPGLGCLERCRRAPLAAP